MTAYNTLSSGFAGLKKSGNSSVKTGAAGEDIEFGRPVFSYDGESKVYNFKLDVAKVVYSADFSSSNSIAVTVNGVSITPVVYGTSHAATVAALVVAVNALTNADCVLDTSDATSKTILIRTKGADCTATSTVTGGSAVTATITQHTGSTFVGVAMHTHKEGGKYYQYDAVNIMRRGELYVSSNTAAETNMIAYLDIAGADKGAFSNAAGTDIGCKFTGNVSGAGIVPVEVNGQVALAYAASF